MRMLRSFVSLAALVLLAAAPASAQYSAWVHPSYTGPGFKARTIVSAMQAVVASPVSVVSTDTSKRSIDVFYNPRWTSNNGQYVRVIATAAQFNDPAGLNRVVTGDADGLDCTAQTQNHYVAIFGVMWPLTNPVNVNAAHGQYTVEWRISPIDSIIALGNECPSL